VGAKSRLSRVGAAPAESPGNRQPGLSVSLRCKFHQAWRDAENGIGDYIAIFVPWYWQEEYARPAVEDFTLTPDEAELRRHHGLTNDQLAWRRAKLAELRDEALFRQEYPMTAAEAFQVTGHDAFIKPELVMRARKDTDAVAYGSLILGYDPAWKTGDRHSIAWRRGGKVLKVESKPGLDIMQGVDWLLNVINTDQPDMVFVDVGGVGTGVYDRLCELGYGRRVTAVNFGSKPSGAYPGQGGRAKFHTVSSHLPKHAVLLGTPTGAANHRTEHLPCRSKLRASAAYSGTCRRGCNQQGSRSNHPSSSPSIGTAFLRIGAR
jgi:hypothetical protein